jgi:hypothetical protein
MNFFYFYSILIFTYINANIEASSSVEDRQNDPLPKYLEIEVILLLPSMIEYWELK